MVVVIQDNIEDEFKNYCRQYESELSNPLLSLDEFVEILENIFKHNNIKFVFVATPGNSYLEFESEKHLTLFLLKWS